MPSKRARVSGPRTFTTDAPETRSVHLGIDLFTRKASCMITNVPGPSARLRLGGRAIDDLIVWAPVAGHLGLGISLVSYDGHVRVGVLSDEGLVPDPAGLARAWEDEVELLAAS